MCRTKGVKAIDAKDSKAFMGVIKQSRTSNPWSITLLALDLLQRVNTVQTKTDIERQFPKLFEGLGKLEEEYKIVLRDDAQPYAQSTPLRIAIPLLPRVKAELERMEQMGVVSHVHEPTNW